MLGELVMTDRADRIQAIMFDWAGTVVDHGSRAPTQVFIELFKRNGIEITEAEARGPMGKAKREHISDIFRLPRVSALWNGLQGRDPSEADIDGLYMSFLPLQKDTLAEHCDVIQGVPEVVAEARRRGYKIGSSTGYTRMLMETVAPLAAAGGFAPDTILCADDVPAGRPAPWLIFQACERMDAYPMSSIVVVDDTTVGIEAGLNAGCWTVAVTRTGNSLGLSEQEVEALEKDDLDARLADARETFELLGADYVIETVADLLPILDAIQTQIDDIVIED
jgi:phosphonoacetaldehyde hydrolase